MYSGNMKKDRLFTNRQLLTLLWPLIIEQALEILVGMADTVMVSSVGEAAISGVSLVDMINQLIITLFGALATGGAVVTSQHLGAKRPEDAARSAGQLVALSALLGVGVAAFCLLTRTWQLRLFFGTISDEVMQACLTYFTITALSFPFLALYNAGAAIFRSTGNSAVSMRVSVIVNAINFCGNAFCVFVLRMGVAGVAVPTLVSRAVGAVIILALAARPDYVLCITPQSVTRLEGRTVRSILHIGIPSAFENSLFQLGRVLVVSMISLFGTVHISANAVANNLDAIGCIVGNAMGLAMITVIGRCVGAQDFDQTRYYTKKAACVGLPCTGRGQCGGTVAAAADSVDVHPDAGDPPAGMDAGYDSQWLRDFPVAGQLCAAQRPARRQRCAVHDGGGHRLDAGLAHGPELDSLREYGHGRGRRLDCHDRGLGLPYPLLCGAVCQRRVAEKCGKEGVIVEKENPYEIHQLECQRPACLPEKGL